MRKTMTLVEREHDTRPCNQDTITDHVLVGWRTDILDVRATFQLTYTVFKLALIHISCPLSD